MVIAALCLLTVGSMTPTAQAEEKVEIKKDNSTSWKMKLKHKGGKEWEGTHEGKTYSIRGDIDFAAVTDEDGDYTVYGTMAPDGTYITTSRVERVNVGTRLDGRDNGDARNKGEQPVRTEKSEKNEKTEKSERGEK
jgi:hypothetical protein